MKECCVFRNEKKFNWSRYERVRFYGSTFEGKRLHTWDDGSRTLYRCKDCGAYILVQESEVHMPDHTYITIIPVEDERHAEHINRTVSAYELEMNYPGKTICFNLGI